MARSYINGAEQILAGSISWDRIASGAIVPTASLTDGALFIKSDGTVSMGAALNMNSNKVTNVTTPTAAGDAANKGYVDALVNGIQLHFARVASVSNIASLSGLPTIDGVTLSSGDRALLTGQTTGSQNGPWLVASGSWTRPADWAAASTLPEGQYFVVDADGTTYKNTKWFCTNTGSIVVDTTATTWTQDASGTSYNAGNGLQLVGTTFSVNPGNGISTGGGTASAVGYATRLVTVDANGIGITDGIAGQLVVANGSNHAAWATMGGDATISSGGTVTVTNTAGSGFTKYTNFVNNETPSGTVNGSNTTFTLASTPAAGSAGISSVRLYLNGQLLEQGSGNDYTISGTSITMLFAPTTGDKLRAYYMK